MFKLFLIFSGLCLIGLLSFFYLSEKDLKIVSPSSKVYGSVDTSLPKNDWFPKVTLTDTVGSDKPQISASGAILVDYDSAETIYAKDANLRLPAASTIKIMTALLALEKTDLESTFTVSGHAAKVGEDSMGLTSGEKVPVRELMYGMMLPSGNDAAVTIAEGIAGSEENFVSLMNNRAKQIGLKNTKFVNSSGLDVDGEQQYSTAYDLAVLTHYVWGNYPKLQEFTATDHIFIDATDTHKAFDLYNDTNLLTTYPGVKGVKPGFTWEAGYCLVTFAQNDGKRLIGVLLNSGNRRHEMKDLLDYGFARYGITVSHPALDL